MAAQILAETEGYMVAAAAAAPVLTAMPAAAPVLTALL
jgi:hypothetical protein